MNTTSIETKWIEPLHEVRDAEKLAALIDSMQVSGWVGRPLLVVNVCDNQHQAYTGSHRLAAAKAVGMEDIPCLVLEAGDFGSEDDYFAFDEAVDDVRRLDALLDINLAEAADLMMAELG